MAEHALKPLTALGNPTPVVVEIGTCRIVERFDVALGSVASRHGREREVAEIAKSAKIPLAAPGQSRAGQVFSSFWLSSEQWMIEADLAAHEDIAAELKTQFGDAASVTEQTDAWVRFDVSASSVQSMFERLCNVDLSIAPTGFASRTVIEHIGCYVIKRSATEVTVYGPRSSAQSLLHGVEAVAHSL